MSSGTLTSCLFSTWRTPTARGQKKMTLCRYHGNALGITDAILGSVKMGVTVPSTRTLADICVTLPEKMSSSCWWRSMRPGRETLGVLLTSVTGSDQPVQFSPISGFLDVENEIFSHNKRWY
ncbi:hypothetical protein B7P43_G06611 [Cryptotermes secundus]|uniref:Uncharacterized protein n=1 Tax=Cryptotermes secundus TaxID=105785 RepID=A0A2J7RDN9_9NEOP|nr:hypothetical protein B7P43_G06611 [Cryptotermes secundus]